MPTLGAYTADLQDLLHDSGGNFFSTPNLTKYINAARSKICQEAQCLRAVTPSSSGVTTITPGAGGSGYTTATVTISPPTGNTYNSVQATATATIAAGAITGYTITNAGFGYSVAPTVTITGNGTGATATAAVNLVWHTVVAQETYAVANAAATITAAYPGIASIIGIQSIAVSWGSFKPVLGYRPFTLFQAYFRAINTGTTNTPSYWSSVGEGTTGTIYLYPIPSQIMAMEWDCYCLPIDLVDNTTVEAIPSPWTEAVIYYAAYRAYMAAQRQPDAQAMLAEYKRKLTEFRAAVSTAQIPEIYGDS